VTIVADEEPLPDQPPVRRETTEPSDMPQQPTPPEAGAFWQDDDLNLSAGRSLPSVITAPLPPHVGRISDTIRSGPAASAAVATKFEGVIVQTDPERKLAHVHFQQEQRTVPVGATLRVYRGPAGEMRLRGELKVVQTFPGSANVRPTSTLRMSDIRTGDVVLVSSAKVPAVSAPPAKLTSGSRLPSGTLTE
jgi:hypothetical protein